MYMRMENNVNQGRPIESNRIDVRRTKDWRMLNNDKKQILTIIKY